MPISSGSCFPPTCQALCSQHRVTHQCQALLGPPPCLGPPLPPPLADGPPGTSHSSSGWGILFAGNKDLKDPWRHPRSPLQHYEPGIAGENCSSRARMCISCQKNSFWKGLSSPATGSGGLPIPAGVQKPCGCGIWGHGALAVLGDS